MSNEQEEELMKNLQYWFRNFISVLLTSAMIWTASSVNEASNTIFILKNDVANIKQTLQGDKNLKDLVMENIHELKTVNYRLDKLESDKR
jgi:surface polysaccharide O-acyltransferase-like enzyme